MIKITFDTPIKLVLLALEERCEPSHLQTAAEAINHFVTQGGELDSVLFSAEKYAHWESFGADVGQWSLDESVINAIKKVAVVTDNPVFDTGTQLSTLFPSAQVFIYSFCEYDQAMAWLADLTEIHVEL